MNAATLHSHDRLPTVLIVDGHPLLRDGVVTRLTAVGMQVAAQAGTAAEALRWLEHGSADVVLTELDLDDMDGAEFTRRLLARHPSAGVVVFTARAGEDDLKRAMAAGARGYVLKRETAARLYTAIRSVADGGTSISHALTSHVFCTALPDSKTLTEREREVLDLLGRGMSTKAVARALDIEVRTVQSHRGNIRRKLQIDGQAALIKYAVEATRGSGVEGGRRAPANGVRSPSMGKPS